MQEKHLIFALLCGLLAACLPMNVHADFFEISSDEMEEAGIDIDRLDPINLTYDGSAFVAAEPIADVKEKAKGFTRTLKVFRFKNKKLEKVDQVKLPLTQWLNAAVGNGKRTNDVFILANHGTKYLRVNLADMKVQTLFEHKKGQPGFKGGPFLWCHGGDFFATGWAYDKDQYWEGDFLTRLKENKQGLLDFRNVRGVRLDEVFNPTDGFAKVYYHISGDRFLYNWVTPKERKTHLKMFRKGAEPLTIDSGYMLAIFIGTESKVFYSVIRDEKAPVLQHYVVDVSQANGKKIQIGENGDDYTYPFISDDGNTLVVIRLNTALRTFSAYCGKAADNYALRKFIHSFPTGPMKLSGDGRVFLLMHERGLRIHYLD